VEGQIRHLKRLNRMFGHAGLARFARRFVLPPGPMHEPVQHPREPSEAQARSGRIATRAATVGARAPCLA
jgi:hypothetical protein